MELETTTPGIDFSDAERTAEAKIEKTLAEAEAGEQRRAEKARLALLAETQKKIEAKQRARLEGALQEDLVEANTTFIQKLNADQTTQAQLEADRISQLREGLRAEVAEERAKRDAVGNQDVIKIQTARRTPSQQKSSFARKAASMLAGISALFGASGSTARAEVPTPDDVTEDTAQDTYDYGEDVNEHGIDVADTGANEIGPVEETSNTSTEDIESKDNLMVGTYELRQNEGFYIGAKKALRNALAQPGVDKNTVYEQIALEYGIQDLDDIEKIENIWAQKQGEFPEFEIHMKKGGGYTFESTFSPGNTFTVTLQPPTSQNAPTVFVEGYIMHDKKTHVASFNSGDTVRYKTAKQKADEQGQEFLVVGPSQDTPPGVILKTPDGKTQFAVSSASLGRITPFKSIALGSTDRIDTPRVVTDGKDVEVSLPLDGDVPSTSKKDETTTSKKWNENPVPYTDSGFKPLTPADLSTELGGPIPVRAVPSEQKAEVDLTLPVAPSFDTIRSTEERLLATEKSSFEQNISRTTSLNIGADIANVVAEKVAHLSPEQQAEIYASLANEIKKDDPYRLPLWKKLFGRTKAKTKEVVLNTLEEQLTHRDTITRNTSAKRVAGQ